jgi:tRNA A-37 threonylcarbamoyl transferase component Bud32
MTPGDRDQFGPFRIVRPLGHGAMGVVYHARDAKQRDVALKVMLPDIAADLDARARFLREAQAMTGLQHRNVITVLECGVHDDTPYIAMELLQGASLKAHMAQGEPRSLERKLDVVIQLCEALEFAHERGIVHRDVKPANIWLLENGGVKLLDFGIARIGGTTMTRTGDVVGSAAYMSPEHAAGGHIDGRADIFAAGVILYEMLAGRRPFEADNLTGVINKILHEEPPRLRTLLPQLSPDIETAVHTALAKDVNARYEHAADFGTDLRLARYQVDELQPTMIAPRPSLDDITTHMDAPPDTREAPPAPQVASTVAVAPAATAAIDEGAPSHDVPVASPAPVGRSRRLVWAGVVAAAVVAVAGLALWRSAPVSYRFDVQSVPPGAAIALDSVPTDAKTPAVLTLARRPARIGLTLAGFEAIERAVPEDAPSGDEPLALRYTLRRLLHVDSEPAGARIFVDNRDTGLATPANLPLPEPAPASIELQLAGGARTRASITPAQIERGEMKVALASPSAAPGNAAAREAARPAATTSVAVHATGAYPFEISGCGITSPPAEAHEIEVAAPCTMRLRAPAYYLDVTRAIGAAAGRVEIAAPQLARVQLRSRYEVCTIVLGGRALGTPPVDLELAAGTYTAVIQCPDQTYYARDIPIDPGRSVRRLDEFLR